MSAPRAPARQLAPLVLATMASQALLVVLAPTIVAVANDLDSSVSVVGQARTVTAAVAVLAAIWLAGRAGAIGVASLIRLGSTLAAAGILAQALAPSIGLFLAANLLAGAGFACLLTAGFAGVAAFVPSRRVWAMGYVAGANALAWILINPLVGTLSGSLSWRVAFTIPALIALSSLLAARWVAEPVGDGDAPSLGSLLRHASARRWIGAELMAFVGWTALLIYVGAFFIEVVEVGPAAAGWLLAAGAACYFVAATRGVPGAARVSGRGLVVVSTLAMAVLIVIQFQADASIVAAAVLFCLIGVAAGVRTPSASTLGLAQLPDQPGAMMAARTAATQLGYLVAAVVGGIVIAGPGYEALGPALAMGLVASAVLFMRVDEPAAGGIGGAEG